MPLPTTFINLTLENRLGQSIELAVNHTHELGRDYVFVMALINHASSLVAKNAEHFAFQLREFFNLDARRFEMIELRGDISSPDLWRWRFDWVGASPLSPKSELVAAQHAHLLSVLNIANSQQAALG